MDPALVPATCPSQGQLPKVLGNIGFALLVCSESSVFKMCFDFRIVHYFALSLYTSIEMNIYLTSKF